MDALRKRRSTVLAIGTGLLVPPLILFWLYIPSLSLNWPLTPSLTLLILALIPVLVGGIVGTWMRPESEHPWLRASGFGVLIWWVLLFVVLTGTFVSIGLQIPTPAPFPPDYGGSGPQPGYGLGLLHGFILIFCAGYAVVGLPFILLGAAITFPRRGTAS